MAVIAAVAMVGAGAVCPSVRPTRHVAEDAAMVCAAGERLAGRHFDDPAVFDVVACAVRAICETTCSDGAPRVSDR